MNDIADASVSGLYEEIGEEVLKIYNKMLPSIIKTYGQKFLKIDRINEIDDFKSFFYEIVHNAYILYKKNHVSKSFAGASWKRKNNKKQNHKMTIETFVIDQLKKKIDESIKVNVVVRNEDYAEEMSYNNFRKKRAYFKAGNFKIDFIKVEVPISELSTNSDNDSDPENYRTELSNEINNILYTNKTEDYC